MELTQNHRRPYYHRSLLPSIWFWEDDPWCRDEIHQYSTQAHCQVSDCLILRQNRPSTRGNQTPFCALAQTQPILHVPFLSYASDQVPSFSKSNFPFFAHAEVQFSFAHTTSIPVLQEGLLLPSLPPPYSPRLRFQGYLIEGKRRWTEKLEETLRAS